MRMELIANILGLCGSIQKRSGSATPKWYVEIKRKIINENVGAKNHNISDRKISRT
tara:strand:+ start:470 stop:637 length:168 start_codon:yes stop_codon:yes gene_type:complete